MTKTTTTERRVTPGLLRLRKAANAEQIRTAVLDDQATGRAEALAKIEAEGATDLPANFTLRPAAQTPADAYALVSAPPAPADAATPATAPQTRPGGHCPHAHP